MIKYIFFDVAGTLLGKPTLYTKIQNSLYDFGYDVLLDEIKNKHKFLSEVIHFPDRTDEIFYQKFNSELLYLLGIIPNEELLTFIFKNCTYLPWEAFEDTKIFGPIFQDVFVSEELGVSKPNIEFYKKALHKTPFLASEILYIGDSIKLDFEPATKLGFNVLIIDRDNFYPNLKNKISNLAEISNFI